MAQIWGGLHVTVDCWWWWWTICLFFHALLFRQRLSVTPLLISSFTHLFFDLPLLIYLSIFHFSIHFSGGSHPKAKKLMPYNPIAWNVTGTMLWCRKRQTLLTYRTDDVLNLRIWWDCGHCVFNVSVLCGINYWSQHPGECAAAFARTYINRFPALI